MDIKNFILTGGGLLIIAVILHGFWVAWRARREPLRLDIAPDIVREDIDEMELLRGELPNGGARVQRDIPEQTSFELEAPPILIEPAPRAQSAPRPSRREPRVRVAEVDVDIGVDVDVDVEVREPPDAEVDGDAGVDELVAESAAQTDPGPREEPMRTQPRTSQSKVREARAIRGRNKPQPTRAVRDATGEVEVVPELIVMHVLNPKNPYNGTDLFNIFRAHGLKYGEMNIFHRKDIKSGSTYFSIASAVEPGTFDLSDMDNYATPGLSFFMKLSQSEQPGDVFEDMLTVAADIIGKLEGELKDEQMNLMTGQTIEHYRARISDYTRRRLTVNGGA